MLIENWRGCVHPGCRLRVSRVCPIPCAHPLLKSPLRALASVTMAFLVVRIGAQNDPCVHPFQTWPLYASVFKSLKNNVRIRTSETLFLLPGVYNRGRNGTQTVQVAWEMIPVDCIPPHRQGLDNGTLWLLLLPPASVQAVLAGENHSCDVSALGVSLHCASCHRRSPRCRLFLCFLLLAFARNKDFPQNQRVFLKVWFHDDDSFWSLSPILTSIIKHKLEYVYMNKLSRNSHFLPPTWPDISNLLNFCPIQPSSVYFVTHLCVRKRVLVCVCLLGVKER